MLLKIPYFLNIIILLPLCWGLLTQREHNISERFFGFDPIALQVLVGSLWSAILICSIAGLFFPKFFIPLLIVQIIYKSLFLIFLFLPSLQAGLSSGAPLAMNVIFIVIVFTYPIFVWFGLKT